MTFSLFKYFDAILDGVEQNGLAALEQPEVKEALAGGVWEMSILLV